jgi:hypothetical protein
MASTDRIYRRTEAGHSALGSGAPLPTILRHMLGLIDSDTHGNVLRKLMRGHTDSAVLYWISELEKLGLVESRPSHVEHDLDFTGSFEFRKQKSPPEAGF